MEPYPQPLTPRDSWPPGTVVKDDYVIESRLGKGGFGTVYKAKHRYLQSDHVIKRLHEEYSSDEDYVRKFIAEGQVIRRLRDCPFIVAVEHMTLTADQYLILIMEFMPGGDLCHLMQERPYFTVAEATGFAVQIAEGLRAAHALDLIHRDIKPANILLAANRKKAKLTDFGIAADHQNAQVTSVVRGGSLGYAAPEQWTTAGRNLDGRADIYALGVTLYQMLTGCMPYAAADIGAWIEAVRTTQPIHPCRLRDDMPEDLDRLVMQMIEVRREHRPPTIESVIECLRPYADIADWSRSSTLRILPERELPLPPPPAPTVPTVAQRARTSGWLWTVPIAVALAGGGGWYAWQSRVAAVQEDVEALKKGDAARDRGDYHAAARYFREQPGGGLRLQIVQAIVEADVEGKVARFSDTGRFDPAEALVEEWLADFPTSTRLQEQKKLIARRRAAQ